MGWLAAKRRALFLLPIILLLGRSDPVTTKSTITTLSWKPRAFLWQNFATESECDHVVSVATPWMRRSTVVDDEDEDDVFDDTRTSNGTFLTRYQVGIRCRRLRSVGSSRPARRSLTRSLTRSFDRSFARQDAVISALEERIAMWTHLNVSNQVGYGLGRRALARPDARGTSALTRVAARFARSPGGSPGVTVRARGGVSGAL